MEQLKTKKLIQGLNKSDVCAFNELFFNYYDKVFNFCQKFLFREADAEEITQEVFIVVWQNRKNIKCTTSFTSYLFGIAKNKIYNLYRSTVYAESYINYILLSDTEFDYVTEKDVLFNELNKIYEDLIQQLPERRRKIFILSRKEGYTYRDIAQELNISENTVDIQIRKALSFLKDNIRLLYK